MTSHAANGDSPTVRYGDQEVVRGRGGETHQTADGAPANVNTDGNVNSDGSNGADGRERLTTQQGVVVADDQNTLRVGERGPGAARGLPLPREDLPLRPRADPRARRARARLRRARLLRELRAAHATSRGPTSSSAPGERTPAFVRFSTVAGNKGSADLARDVRGFAVKLYTAEGNWDLVGNNIPVFFIQDAIKFPDLIHAAKQEPDRGFPQAQTAHDNFWDFVSLMPESTHMLHVDHVGPGDPALVPVHGGLRRPHLPPRRRRGPLDLRQVPLEAEARAAVGGLERGGQDQRRRPRLPPPRPVGRDQSGRLPRVGAGPAALRRGRSPTSSTSTCSTRPSSSPRRRCRSAASAGWCSTAWSTTSSPRPSRSRSARRTSSRASTSPTTRCCRAATSPTSTPRSSGSAARTSPTSRSTRRSARSRTSSRTATWRSANPTTRANYEPNSWRAPSGGPREDPSRGFRSVPRATRNGAKRRLRPESFADHYSQARQFYLSQTESSSATSRRVHVRAEQVRAAGDPRADGRRPAQRRRGPRADRRRGPRPARLPERSPAGPRSRSTTCPPSPALSILAKARRELRRAQARHPGHRRRRRELLARCAPPRPNEQADVELIAPTVGGVTSATARGYRRPEDRRRAVGALRRGRDPRSSEGGAAPWRPARPRGTSSPTRSPTASSSATPAARPRCSRPRGCPPTPPTRRRVHQPGRVPGGGVHHAVPSAPALAAPVRHEHVRRG